MSHERLAGGWHEGRPSYRPVTLPSLDGVLQADGGIKKGRAAFGDLTNQSQGQAPQLSAQVQSFDAAKILLATDCQLQQQTFKACLCHHVILSVIVHSTSVYLDF